ncbi:hypothetical protein CLOSTASPAR_03387 [[Clostridium] asparagiforme DSM 15981]|uniref:Uncharacterized protein n=1 Tax=[Clostridium] asparagiforme DSM 15981 TaxID=518636 RepID=C0D297_9FIRM|nr:hypothetical protein CLOSTASPAR_03387 [[Clostridium] asparagiforme DSM 15981]
MQLTKRLVRQNPFVSQITIGQDTHGQVRPIMGAHISVTGRPAITEIKKFSPRAPVVPIYNTSGAKRSVGVTVWAFNFF